MNTASNELKRLVDSGKLNITYVDAPPRTLSTALLRSLSHIYDAALSEPFHYPPDFESGCQKILNAAHDAGVEDHNIKIVIKDMARLFPKERWETWMPYVDHFVTVVRDPHLQIPSIFIRAANDLATGADGLDTLQEEQVWKHAEDLTRVFKEGGQVGGRGPNHPAGFVRTGWGFLSEHLALLKPHLEAHPNKTLSIVCGTMLRAQPAVGMKQLIEKLGFEANDQNLNKVLDWNPDTSKIIVRPTNLAYVKRAADTSTFEPPIEDTPPLGKFPEDMQTHILETALPIYVDFVRCSQRIGPTLPSELEKVFYQEKGGKPLADYNPVTAYTFISTIGEQGLRMDELKKKTSLIERLKHDHPEHKAAMERIDEIVSGIEKPSDNLTVFHMIDISAAEHKHDRKL